MEKSVEEQFSEGLLHQAARRFGLKEQGLELLGKFENYVYEGEKDGNRYILRLVHSSHREENMILGELDWLRFLSEQGIKVAKPNPSINGNLVEIISVEKGYFLVSLFDKAPGKIVDPTNKLEWNGYLFEKWGRTIAEIHRATKEYQVPNDRIKRPAWDEDDLLDLEKYIGNEEEKIINIAKQLVDYLNSLPRDKDSYGLIHTDIHFGNFFVDGGEITVFDFDDCSYQWYISDIAIALYYSVWRCVGDKTEEEKLVFATEFLRAFFRGYNEIHRLDQYWIDQLPYFLRLRDIVLYSVLNKKLDKGNLTERQIDLLNQIKDRIEKEIPIVTVSL
ncbi:phosphotransferase enzyme family protein [Alkaliphilus transvaalensis]|uniref:phosphotransferase enzyme family protein n=1 Tax=Alkaliphilus transvaalensis TaxID=114628 RepID=UPI00047CB551|nr:phosphotransferase [Alkaliphilus transvaalensis]